MCTPTIWRITFLFLSLCKFFGSVLTTVIMSQISEMQQKFLDQSYPSESFDKALSLAFTTMATQDGRISKSKRIPYVQSHRFLFERFKKTVARHTYVLKSYSNLCSEVKQPPLHTYRHSKNLRDLFVRADLIDKYQKKPLEKKSLL